MQNLVIFNLPFMLGASKNTEYQQRCRERCKTLLKFLDGNSMLRPPTNIDDIEAIPDSFILRSSALTDEGVDLVKLGLNRWLTAQDKGKTTSDAGELQSALLKIRASDADAGK